MRWRFGWSRRRLLAVLLTVLLTVLCFILARRPHSISNSSFKYRNVPIRTDPLFFPPQETVVYIYGSQWQVSQTLRRGPCRRFVLLLLLLLLCCCCCSCCHAVEPKPVACPLTRWTASFLLPITNGLLTVFIQYHSDIIRIPPNETIPKSQMSA